MGSAIGCVWREEWAHVRDSGPHTPHTYLRRMSTTISQEAPNRKRADIASDGPVVRRVWFTMVLVPTKGWTRVGKAYGSRKSARGWLGFVGKAWRGLRTRVAQCTLRWNGGVMDERSRRILSEKFNMEPPSLPPRPAAVDGGSPL